jgi:hypothetical protein
MTKPQSSLHAMQETQACIKKTDSDLNEIGRTPKEFYDLAICIPQLVSIVNTYKHGDQTQRRRYDTLSVWE